MLKSYTTIPLMKKTRRQTNNTKLILYLSYGMMLIMLLLPFHAFFTTWAGASFGYIDVFRIWKEILILLLGLGAVALLLKDRLLRREVFGNFIIQAILAYTLFSILRALYGYSSDAVSLDAMLFGLIVNLRYLAFFGLVYVVGLRTSILRQTWEKIVLIPAMIVIGFGIIQHFLLSKNFLEHFGYGPDTIPAYQSVDQKPEYIRLQSTMRGANPLGAYLVLIGSLLTARLVKVRNWQTSVMMAATLLVIFFTYSRSAWIGLAVSLVSMLLVLRPKLWKPVFVLSIAFIMVAGAGLYALRENDHVQNILFHSDETSLAEASSNEVRYRALSTSVGDIFTQPLGGGVGSAGPASFRNTKNHARIAENYFIQIGQEAGIVGLVMYVAILAAVVKGLWQRRYDRLGLVLFASFIGIAAVNMISHAWADDTLSLLWWGLAGIALSTPVILKGKRYDQKTNTR